MNRSLQTAPNETRRCIVNINLDSLIATLKASIFRVSRQIPKDAKLVNSSFNIHGNCLDLLLESKTYPRNLQTGGDTAYASSPILDEHTCLCGSQKDISLIGHIAICHKCSQDPVLFLSHQDGKYRLVGQICTQFKEAFEPWENY